VSFLLLTYCLTSLAYKFEQKECDDLPGKNDPKSGINLWLGFKEIIPLCSN